MPNCRRLVVGEPQRPEVLKASGNRADDQREPGDARAARLAP
jgi:hypothetical protein